MGLDDLWIERFELDRAGGLPLLQLDMLQGDAGLTARLDYSTHLFDDATVTGMLRDLRTLLESVVAKPEQRISELPLPARTASPARSVG